MLYNEGNTTQFSNNFNKQKEREELIMKTLLGVTMIFVGMTRLATGGIVTGVLFTAWGIRILKKA